MLDFSTVEGLDFSITPQTIVVGSDGMVDHVFPGAFAGSMLTYAEYVFGVSLPGLNLPTESLQSTTIAE